MQVGVEGQMASRRVRRVIGTNHAKTFISWLQVFSLLIDMAEWVGYSYLHLV
jgi:hypothetical protein